MRGKKYLWTLAAVYMAYLTHGIQAIILSQNKVSFFTQWGYTDATLGAAAVSAVIAYTGLAKFLSVWICGEISDKIGRKSMIATGGILYLAAFAGLWLSHSYTVACVCAFALGLATSFFDGACYPAVQESWIKSPGTGLVFIKGFISVSGMVYPLLVVSLTNSGNWTVGVILPIIMSAIVVALAFIAPYSYDKELKEKRAAKKAAIAAGTYVAPTKEDKLDDDAKRGEARFVKKPPIGVVIGCALYGFIAMATMFSAQQYIRAFGETNLGMTDFGGASLTTVYTVASLAAVLIMGFLMSKFRWRTLKVLLIDLIGSIIGYGIVYLFPSTTTVYIGTVMIGFFAAGGALQCGVALIQEMHPGNKGRNLGIYYTFMGLASYVIPYIQAGLIKLSGEAQATATNLLLNLGMAVVGLLFMLYLIANYKKWFGVSPFSKKGDDE